MVKKFADWPSAKAHVGSVSLHFQTAILSTGDVMRESAAQNMNAYWMPFTANRDFQSSPRMLVPANGMYYRDKKGCEILDGAVGLWCVQNLQPSANRDTYNVAEPTGRK